MVDTRRLWMGAVMAVLALRGVGVAAERSALVLHVDDRIGVSAGDLAVATREVEAIFADAGVRITWNAGRFPASVVTAAIAPAGTRHVAVLLVANSDDPLPGASGYTLGFAAKRPAVAYAYYNRIIELSWLHPIDPRVLLGRVIAHELGHVLLPPNSHSLHGIMRGNIDLGLENPDRFTRDQALAIRATLAGMAIGR
jgi:hypothetical protein